MTHSDDLKLRIVYLNHDGHSMEEIPELLYLSESLVQKILQTYNHFYFIKNPFKEALGQKKSFN
ncbi:26476_t:CDS:1, partial [Dentiscutata erythropus]